MTTPINFSKFSNSVRKVNTSYAGIDKAVEAYQASQKAVFTDFVEILTLAVTTSDFTLLGKVGVALNTLEKKTKGALCNLKGVAGTIKDVVAFNKDGISARKNNWKDTARMTAILSSLTNPFEVQEAKETPTKTTYDKATSKVQGIVKSLDWLEKEVSGVSPALIELLKKELAKLEPVIAKTKATANVDDAKPSDLAADTVKKVA